MLENPVLRQLWAGWVLLFMCLSVQAAEEQAWLQTATGTIAATVTLPDAPCPCPVALIIAGSGPTDRDGNSNGLRSDAYRLLARSLAVAGVASLRYDKRGIGASAAAGRDERDLRFATLVDDARGWLKYLANDQRFSAIAVLGHSEGSLIGMLSLTAPSAGQAAPQVRAFVSLAGPAQAASDLLRRQLANRLPPALVEPNARILAALEAGKTVEAVPVELLVLYRPTIQAYLIDWFRYRPSDVLRGLAVPTLIVQGDKDQQVSVDEARLLKAARPDATLLLVPGMTHTLKHIDSDAQQTASYTDPRMPMSPRLLETLIPFLQQHLGATP